MALICDIELGSGIQVENAYHIIYSFAGTEHRLNFTVNVYVDKKAFDEGKQVITSKSYDMDFDKDRNLFRQMYEHLISLPEFAYATEA